VKLPCRLREKITADSSLCWKSGVSLKHIILAGKAGAIAVLPQQSGKQTEMTGLLRTKQEKVDGKSFLFTNCF